MIPRCRFCGNEIPFGGCPKTVCQLKYKEDERLAQLQVEADEVYQRNGLTPSQLAERLAVLERERDAERDALGRQKQELVEALQNEAKACPSCDGNGWFTVGRGLKANCTRCSNIRTALAKAAGGSNG